MLCSAVQFISCRDRAFLQVFNKAINNPLSTNSLLWWMLTFVSPLILVPFWINFTLHFPGRDMFCTPGFHAESSVLSPVVPGSRAPGRPKEIRSCSEHNHSPPGPQRYPLLLCTASSPTQQPWQLWTGSRCCRRLNILWLLWEKGSSIPLQWKKRPFYTPPCRCLGPGKAHRMDYLSPTSWGQTGLWRTSTLTNKSHLSMHLSENKSVASSEEICGLHGNH